MEFGKEYIKLFETEAEYLAFTASTEYILPNVSHIKQSDNTHYVPLITIADAVITCNSVTYNGEAQSATISVALSGNTLVKDTDYTISGTTSGTNAGDYSFTINGIGNYKGSKNGTFTINKVTPTVVAPTAKVLTYNGSAQELVNAGSTDWGTLQYRAGSDSWSTSIPTRTRGGSYTVEYKVVGDSNINDVAAQSVNCSINEKPVTATVELSQTAYTYNGTAFEPSVTVKDGGTVIDPSEYSVVYSNNVNAGTGTVTISDNTGGDYEVIGSATFTINKADPVYTAPVATSPTYNGSEQALLNAGSTSDGTIQYSTDESTWGTTIPSQTNANTYTSYWRIVGDSNHNDKASASISTTISPKVVSSPTITLSQTVYTYNATACQPTATVNDGVVTIASSEYTVSYSDNINAGTATCTITDKTGGNYTVSGSEAFTINKVTPTVTAPIAKSLTYTGSAQALVNAGSTNWGTLKYSLDDSTYSTGIPSGTNATSYTVYYKVDGDSNINSVAAQSVAVTIAKADQAAPSVTGATTTYPTTATATANGGGGQGSIEWESAQSQSSVGSHTTRARWTGNSNYNASPWSSSVTVQMNKAAGSVTTAPVNTNYTYNGTARAVASAGSGTGTMYYRLGSSGSFSTTMPTMTNAGSDTLYYYAAASTNYEQSATGSITVTVQKASQNAPTATGATTTYNTTATATASGGGGQGSIEWSNGNTQTSVGSKTTKARWSGNSNYNPSPYSNEVTIKMNKADQSAPTATGATVDYGSTATATASGGGGQGTLTWTNGNTRTAVGSQTTQAYWSGNGNYNASPYSNSVTLTVNDPYAGHAYVDLGLPSGTKWATMNVGASSVSDYGNFYQYGKGSAQYAATSGQSDYEGTEDPLATSADTAAQVWGGSWHMPTKAQFEELTANTTYEWTTIDSINGGKFTAQNGNYVFFPAAGYWHLYNGHMAVGSNASCWSSTPGGSDAAWFLYLSMWYDTPDVGNTERKMGYPIRGVVG